MNNSPVLPAYSEKLFRNKVVTISDNSNGLKSVDLWWQTLDEKQSWINRLQSAVNFYPKGTPEKTDALTAFKGCKELFDKINQKLADLVNRNTSNLIVEYWIKPIASVFYVSKESLQLDEIIAEIEFFEDKYWSDEVDVVIAVAEALASNSHRPLKDLRLMVAQWSFQEFIRNINPQKLFHLFDGLPDQYIIDELDIEIVEIRDALAGFAWTTEKREKYRRIYNQVRRNMDQLQCTTTVKKGFNRMFDYATGDAGESVSMMDILKNAETTWDGFKNDSTLHEFWEDEQQRLEDSIGK